MMASESFDEPMVWLNGSYLPLSRASISPFDRGFQYGDGVFETMRAEDGRILDLSRHLERMKHSLAELQIRMNESLEWQEILGGLLARNHLLQCPASVKIIVTRGISPEMGLPVAVDSTVFALCRRFEPPTEMEYRTGWKLVAPGCGHAPSLAAHKTLNYLFFLKARQQATDQGADEAVVLDPGGMVSETAAGALLARSGGRWWTPGSPFQLPSVTLARLIDRFAAAGHSVTKRDASLDDLETAETVWVISSLTLIMPVSHLGGRPLHDLAVAEAAHWRQILLTTT